MSIWTMSWGDMMDEEERLQNRTALERVKDELKELIEFKKELKETAADEDAYNSKMAERVAESLAYLDTHKENAVDEDKVAYWKTRGLICMESPSYVNEAVDSLSKAVKLDPTAVEYWNNLGEAYCSLKNWELGKKCFLSALEHEKNAVSLQNLSMWCRMKDNREASDIADGINYAKEALTLDFSNIKSWTILGNAYMAAFFAAHQDEKLVTKALHSYKQAEKTGKEDVEVCSNIFVALKFLEHYEEALRSLLPAFSKPELEWRQKKADFENLINYLKAVQDLVDKKGKLRPKKLAEYSKELKQDKHKRKAGKSSSDPIEPESGPSGDEVERITGIIIFILTPDETYPYTLGMLTGVEDVCVVTVFNLRRDKGFKIGDHISVPVVTMTLIDFTINNDTFKFSKIRLFMPTQMILNGKWVTPMYLNPMVITSTELSKKAE